MKYILLRAGAGAMQGQVKKNENGSVTIDGSAQIGIEGEKNGAKISRPISITFDPEKTFVAAVQRLWDAAGQKVVDELNG